MDNSVARIDVSPASAQSLTSGTTVTLTATAYTRSNTSLGSGGINWSSSDANVASVAGGVVTAKLVGTASITASSSGVTSSAVTVTVTPGAAAQLVVKTQPAGAAAGLPFSTQPAVAVSDAAGNVVTSSSVAITAALASGGGTLSGTATVNAASGVATFSGLAVSGLTGARTLTFSAAGLGPATSASFALAAGTPTRLNVRTQPVAGTAYALFTTPAVLEILDASGNVTTSTATIDASIASGGGTLAGTTSVAATAGVASFATLKINGTAGARTLTFASGTLTPVTTASFNVAAAPPAIITASVTTIQATFGNNPAPVLVDVTNTGVFPLTNLRVQSITYSSGSGWLAAAFPLSTDAPAVLRLTPTTASLAVGTYTASIVLAGDGASTTKTLTVTVVVNPLTTNAYGTSTNKVSLLTVGATLSPGLTTTSTGGAAATDPTLTLLSRNTAIATVDASGKITAVAPGQAWIVAASTQSNSDSVHVIVPKTSGVVLKTNLTKYQWALGDTISVRVSVDTRGTALTAATLTLSWLDTSGPSGTSTLSLVDIAAASSTMSPYWAYDVQRSNVIRINANSTAGATGVVDLIVARFRVIRAGTNAFFVGAIELLGTDLASLLTAATTTQYPVNVP